MSHMTFRVFEDHTGAWRWAAWTSTKRACFDSGGTFRSRRGALANVRRIINAIRADFCEIREDGGKRTML